MKDLRILLIDDSLEDEIILSKKLETSGYRPEINRLTDLESIKNIAIKKSWDIIITDHILPDFTAVDLIQMLEANKFDIPVLIVSRMITEDFAV